MDTARRRIGHLVSEVTELTLTQVAQFIAKKLACGFKSKTLDVVLRHTLPVFTGLGRCPIVSWDFAGAVSIFGLDALPVVHQ